ncbi:MAG: hypothetical protein RIQ99_785 [Pseudomonadota bacterium]|jgi:pilus assembly protein CpaF
MESFKEQVARWGRYPSATAPAPAGDAAAPGAGPKIPKSAIEAAVSKPTGNKLPVSRDDSERAHYNSIKTQLHQLLLSRIDLGATETMAPERLRERLREATAAIIAEEMFAINQAEHDQIVDDLQNEIIGLGPLEPLLADPTISEIMVNGAKTVFVERRGQLELTDIQFNDDEHLLKIIDKIVSRVGRRIDEASPMADARLPDGSRVNAIIPPLAIDGPSLSIRRFAVVAMQMKDLIAAGALNHDMAELLAGLVKAKANIIISGGTGSGKTTLLNILSSYIPSGERIITIEDTAELQLQQRHVVRLETRPPNIEGKGAISMRTLVVNSLRMRPDRIVVGECRSGEVIDMLQAMNTGHKGSLTTIHANTPRDALARMENLIGMAGLSLPQKALREQITSAVDIIVQVTRLADGSRKIVRINELTGMEGEIITTQDIFAYEMTGTGPDGKVQGRFRPTGVRPMFAERLEKHGIVLRPDMFNPDVAGD